jgi:hypothetical protein
MLSAPDGGDTVPASTMVGWTAKRSITRTIAPFAF